MWTRAVLAQTRSWQLYNGEEKLKLKYRPPHSTIDKLPISTLESILSIFGPICPPLPQIKSSVLWDFYVKRLCTFCTWKRKQIKQCAEVVEQKTPILYIYFKWRRIKGSETTFNFSAKRSVFLKSQGCWTHRSVDWVLSVPSLLACIPLSSCTRPGPYSWWSRLCLCRTPWTPHGVLQRGRSSKNVL